MMGLLSVYRKLKMRRFASKDPVGFARSLGVRVGEGVRFYGVDAAMFGSEPWLITIGSNVYITAGVQFVNHDGGTRPLRREAPTWNGRPPSRWATTSISASARS
jgi:hypothetical protein